jgi:CRP-like cAMP-binding protein
MASRGPESRGNKDSSLVGIGMEKVPRSARQLLRVMEEMPTFKMMHDRERTELGEIADIVRCPGGTIIYEDREEGEFVYFIIQGSVELRTRVGPGMAHTVRDFKDEGIVGLGVALGATEYHLQCYARDKTAALRFKRSELQRILRAGKPAAIKLFTAMGLELGRQLRTATNEVVYMLEKTSMMPAKSIMGVDDDGLGGIL